MKIYRIKVFYLFIMAGLLSFQYLYAQVKMDYNNPVTSAGYPLIKNYLPKDYKAHNQNWAIAKDKRGVMYFGNSSGLLEFDGYDWKLIEIPNGIVRSLAVDNFGTVFIGCADDAGYLKKNPENGSVKFKSLLDHFPVKNSIGHVWYTFFVDEYIFFISDKYIFRISFDKANYSNPQIKYWQCKVRYKSAHKVENTLYVQETADGLLKYLNDDFEIQHKFDSIKDRTIFSILPYNKSSLLFGLKKEGLFLYGNGKLKPFNSSANAYLLEKELYLPGTKLPDETFVFGTTQGGVVIMNSNGNIAKVIDTKSGILDDGVLYTYYSEGKLWLALQNGISVVDLPSPVGLYNYNSGLKGAVSVTYMEGDQLFAATTAGVFNLLPGNSFQKPFQFVKLRNSNQEAWQFTNFNGQTLVVMTDGVYIVKRDRVEKINIDLRGCYSIAASPKFKNLLYVGTGTGLVILEFRENKWIEKGKINNLNVAVRNIYEDKSGNVWLGTAYDGLYRLKNLNTNFNSEPTINHYTFQNYSSNDEIKIFTLQNDLLFITKNGVFKFNQSTDSLVLENNLGINEYLKKSTINYLLVDEDNTIWISSLKNNSQLMLTKGIIKSDGTYKWEELLFLRNIIDFSNSNAVTSISKDEQTGIVWFCGADGIISYNINNKNLVDKNNFSALITNITLNGDSVLYVQNNLLESQKDKIVYSLNHDFNSLRFKFSSLKYDANLSEYQYKLEGLNDAWSSWTSENNKDYTNLPPDNYTFKVKAKDINNNISTEAVFEFTVLAPWYLKWYAFLLYSIIVVLISYLILKVRFNHLTKQNLKLESIISERTKLIREQSEKLEQLDEIKTKFFTNISHEFRTPLTLIVGYIQQVLEKNKDENINDDLIVVRRNSNKLLGLINQLLDFSKLSSGKMKLKTIPLNLVEIIKSTILAFSSFADKKNIEFNLHSLSDNVVVYVDKDKVEKILTNIFSNAFKFTPEFGKIDVSIIENKESISINISDTGIGIPKDKTGKIFDRFYQAGSNFTNAQQGTGIGLSLVKELVELHKGKIEVESEEGRGTTFRIILKSGKSHLSTEEVIEEAASHSNNEEIYYDDLIDTDRKYTPGQFEDVEISDKPRLLIVEDNFDVRNFVKENMKADYLINEAADGIAGFNLAIEFIPDIIISDVMMPKMDGYQLCAKLKSDTRTSHIPVILLTAKAESDDKISGLELGADEYIIKPFEMNELKVRIKNLIEQRKRLHKHFKANGLIELDKSSITSTDKKFLQNVYNSINENLSDSSFSVEALSQKIGISRSVLHKKLVSLIGEPPVELIRRIRLTKSAEMIKKKFGNLSEISLEVGFNNPAYFSECFKKHFGVPPSQYQSKSGTF